MSSILDALKKLEADKAARLAQDEGMAADDLPDTAPPDEHAPESAPAPTHTFPIAGLSVRMIIAGIAIFAVCLVAVSVTVSLLVTQRVAPTQVAAVAPTAPAPVAAPAEVVPAPAEESVIEAAMPEPPLEVVVVDTPAPAPVSPDKPSLPAPPKPAAPAPVVVAEATLPSSPPPVAADTNIPLVKDMEPVDVDGLTPLRTTERIRYGLENMKINMLREPNVSRPNGLAVINLVKFYVGEVITGTRARLIGVEGHGIAIEMIDSGERYFVAY